MIGIISAMSIENEALQSQMTDKKAEKVAGMEFVSGILCGKPVVTVVCGIGKVAAAMCAQAMILKYNPECIINSGVAGSLSNELNILDIAVGESFVEHDMDTSPLGDPFGTILGPNIINIPADKSICEKVIKCAAELNIVTKKGVIASGDQFINSKEQKDFIVGNFNAIACEMEGAAIAHVCYLNETPVCVVRAISDCADGSSHMDYPEFLPKAAKAAEKLIEKFVTEY